MAAISAWSTNEIPAGAKDLGAGVAFSWTCNREDGHVHEIGCLWVWHNCQQILGPETIAPGEHFGWRPSGVGAHTLVRIHPLTITASVYWPDCCSKHGFITDGVYTDV